MPTPPDWEANASPPGGGTDPLKRGVERDVGQVAHQPEAVGSDDADAPPSGEVEHGALHRGPLLAELLEAGGDDDRGRDAASAASVEGRRAPPCAGTAITARSTGPGTSTRRGLRGDAPDLGDGGVHGVHGAGEAAGHDRAQHRRAHAGPVAPYPGHGRRCADRAAGAARGSRRGTRARRRRRRPRRTRRCPSRRGRSHPRLRGSPRSRRPRTPRSSPWLSPRTSATKRRSPRSRPAAARCSSSRLPSPRPCRVSSTRKLTSATPGPTGSAVPSATRLPARSTTRASVSGIRAQVLDVRAGHPTVGGEEPQPQVVVGGPRRAAPRRPPRPPGQVPG